MTDSRDKFRALWCRQLSGEVLNEAESQQLKNVLHKDPELNQELNDDATTHAILRSLEDVARTEDAFVEAVLQQVRTAQESPSTKAKLTDHVPDKERNSPSSSEHESSGMAMVVEESRHNGRRVRSRQRSQQWISLLLSLVLFVSVGLTIWLQGQKQTEIAGTGPSPVEQKVEPSPETPPQGESRESDLKRNVAASNDELPAELNVSEDAISLPPRIAAHNNGPTRATAEGKLTDLESPNGAQEPPPTTASPTFATLTKLENPVWEREDTVGARMGDEVVRLFGGTVELTFDGGAVVTLEGPVEYQPRTSGLLDLRRGQLSATVPSPAIGFTILTPTSEVVDLGTQFDVSVKDSGASDVIIRKGKVEVAPGGRTGRDIQQWKLIPGGLNHASFYPRPGDGKIGPIVAKVHGARGQFEGIISLNGKTAKFRSEDTFNNVHERVIAQLQKPQNGMTRQWQDFVNSMQGKMQGTMNFNGQQMQFGSLDEVMRLHHQLQEQIDIDAGTPFSGSIKINGKVIQFKTREEFETARRAAFGAAANFGAGEISEKQPGPE